MNGPRIEVDLVKLRHNTRTVVERLKARGISVSAVTKAVCGEAAIAQAMLEGGAANLADARLRNVRKLRKAGITCPITLLRTPMLSQTNEVVTLCEASYNTEIAVISALAAASIRCGTVHNVILMVEMGDLREGIMPKNLPNVVQQVEDMPGVILAGIGANFACLSGIPPDAAKMRALSRLASATERQCARPLQTISGGNSATLPWALSETSAGRINNLRIGEAILLGVDPVSGDRINGLFTDAFTLVAEVIETDTKPASPVNNMTDPAWLRNRFTRASENGRRLIIALGHQDTDVSGLAMPAGYGLVGVTSDHLVVSTTDASLEVGSKVSFQMNYSAFMRAMAAPDIETILLHDIRAGHARDGEAFGKQLVHV